MRKEEIIQLLKNQDYNKIKLAITDLDGVLRGKYIHKSKLLSILDSGFGFCDVVFGWDSADILYDKVEVTGWHTGFPDSQAQIDPGTLRRIPWENDTFFFLADFSGAESSMQKICPRTLLKHTAKKCIDSGYTPVFSQEFEWFNFKKDTAFGEEFKSEPLTPGMFGYSILRSSEKSAFFNDLFDLLERFDIPLEGLHTETGPGVYEAAIQYSEILLAADRAALFKTAVKEIGYKHDVLASFMAKQSNELPGCSGHVHQSLWDLDKKNNLFFDPDKNTQMSDLMESYVAGQLYCLPHILPMFAPTINSYKRLVEGAWAPTTCTWARDNRTTALRVLNASAKSARLETRVVGSDVNPYLAMSACLASGLYGIEKNLSLEVPETVGNGYEDQGGGRMPGNLRDAAQTMSTSELANELFGETFVSHFTKTRLWEWQQFSNEVTDWEKKRYFEII
ncbi:MAG: glutamine synthetase family protein [Flavobacteriales bacterium]|nr:glutamine synthetase family protein [Flavobacteriales bacterium]